LGSATGEGHRLHARADEVYVAGERIGNISGGLNCSSGSEGPCPLVGVYSGSGQVQWNGTPLHYALNGWGMSAVYDISDLTIPEIEICENPPCPPAEDIHWWFVGQRLGVSPRPQIVYCFQATPLLISCQTSIGASFDKAMYDGYRFVGVEVPVSSGGLMIADPIYNTAVFGLQEGAQATVKVDPDSDPDNVVPDGVRSGPFDTTLRGSFATSCNAVIEYGTFGSVLCEAPDVASIGCEAGTPWTCSVLLTGDDFLHGTVAGRPLLVTPDKLWVHATGATSDPEGWVPIDFKLEARVTLAAVAGDSGQWYVLANDRNTGDVRVFRFTW